MTVGLWLLAIVTVAAAQTTGYLLAVGAAPLRFQAPNAPGLPTGWPPLPQPNDCGINVTTLATNALTLTDVEATDNSALPPPSLVAQPTPVPPTDPSQISLPPQTESAAAANNVIDMQSVLSCLLPISTNASAGSLMLPGFAPVFVPATPPRSSQAVYESR